MKKHFIALSFMLTQSYAGLFGPDQETIELQQRLAEQQDITGVWMIIAGGLAVFVIIAFIVGTILGTKALRAIEHGKDTKPSE